MRKRFQTVLFYLRLVREDLRVRYSGTFFGVLWAYALPLLTLFVFWFVFQMGFRNEPVIGVPYILWFASAYVPWIFFTDIVTQGGGVFLEYSYLVKKIRFTVSLLPLVKAGTAVFIHLPFLLFLVLLAVWYGYPLPIGFVWIFYYLLLALCLGSILAYLVATITVFFRDIFCGMRNTWEMKRSEGSFRSFPCTILRMVTAPVCSMGKRRIFAPLLRSFLFWSAGYYSL